MNTNKIAREVKSILKETDVKLKQIKKVCEQGCSYCCYQLIPIHDAEAYAIRKYIDSTLKEEYKNKGS